ncbi:hypothetical protein D3C85_1335030 [compost metagenome]
MAQGLHPSGSVHFGGFDQALRNVVDGRDVDYHEITRILPDKDNHYRPERGSPRTQPRQIEKGQAGHLPHRGEPSDKNKLPDEPEQQAANDMGDKKYRSQHIARKQPAG